MLPTVEAAIDVDIAAATWRLLDSKQAFNDEYKNQNHLIVQDIEVHGYAALSILI